MSKINDLLATIETIGTTQPISDENGALTIAPTHKRDPNITIDEKVIMEAKSRKSEYDRFFSEVSKLGGASPTNTDNVIRQKAKAALTEAVNVMNVSYMENWTDDKNIIDACNKLRPILSKIVSRL